MFMSKYAINMGDGRLSVYINGVTNCCYAQIPDAVAEAMKRGEVTWQAVVNAVNKKRFQDPNFDWTELAQKKEELNVRKGSFDLAEELNNPASEVADDDPNMISLSDVKNEDGDNVSDTQRVAAGKTVNAKGKKPAKSAKAEDATKDNPSEDGPQEFDDGEPDVTVTV